MKLGRGDIAIADIPSPSITFDLKFAGGVYSLANYLRGLYILFARKLVEFYRRHLNVQIHPV